VTVGWSKHVRPTRIIVADDNAAANPLRRGVLQMIPILGVRVSVILLAEFLKLTGEGPGGDRVFLIVSNPTELLKLVEGGLQLTEVIVGNLGYQTGWQKVSKEVHAEPELAGRVVDAGHQARGKMDAHIVDDGPVPGVREGALMRFRRAQMAPSHASQRIAGPKAQPKRLAGVGLVGAYGEYARATTSRGRTNLWSLGPHGSARDAKEEKEYRGGKSHGNRYLARHPERTSGPG